MTSGKGVDADREAALSALAHAATWIIESNGYLKKGQLQLPDHDGRFEVVPDMVIEALGERYVAPGGFVDHVYVD